MAGGELEIDIPAGWTILKKADATDTLFDEATYSITYSSRWMVHCCQYTILLR